MENTLILEPCLRQEGRQYAENILHGQVNHLHLDKAFIAQELPLHGKKVLDFGCGMGGMTLWYAQNYDCEVTGLDVDPHHLAIAQDLLRQYPNPRIRFVQQDILENPLREYYDIIILNDVAEHIPLPVLEKILLQLKNRLHNGGKLLISYPPWESPYASHLNHVIKMPWCQFLPKFVLHRWLQKKNRPLVGLKDLRQEFEELNHLNHRRLMALTQKAGLRLQKRVNHSRLHRWLGVKTLSLPLLKYLITKELLIFSR